MYSLEEAKFLTMPGGREYQANASSELVSILGAFLYDFLIREIQDTKEGFIVLLRTPQPSEKVLYHGTPGLRHD